MSKMEGKTNFSRRQQAVRNRNVVPEAVELYKWHDWCVLWPQVVMVYLSLRANWLTRFFWWNLQWVEESLIHKTGWRVLFLFVSLFVVYTLLSIWNVWCVFIANLYVSAIKHQPTNLLRYATRLVGFNKFCTTGSSSGNSFQDVILSYSSWLCTEKLQESWVN